VCMTRRLPTSASSKVAINPSLKSAILSDISVFTLETALMCARSVKSLSLLAQILSNIKPFMMVK
jgi:hypothetical protein